jgi:hypothetical protein
LKNLSISIYEIIIINRPSRGWVKEERKAGLFSAKTRRLFTFIANHVSYVQQNYDLLNLFFFYLHRHHIQLLSHSQLSSSIAIFQNIIHNSKGASNIKFIDLSLYTIDWLLISMFYFCLNIHHCITFLVIFNNLPTLYEGISGWIHS